MTRSKVTAHSEYGRLKKVILNHPNQAFVDQDFINLEWQKLNFLAAPSMQTARDEYGQLENLLKAVAPEIQYLSFSNDTTLDAVYCRDASITTDFGVILCNMGKDMRVPEPKNHEEFYKSQGIKILGRITSPGTIEGGDVAWLDESTLAVGHTYRTNYDGIAQMKKLLEPQGVAIITAEMPHFQGPADVFHLMSVFSPVDEKKAVVYSPMMPIHFRQMLLDRGFELIEVPEDEFVSMGCNVLAIAPSQCVMVKGNPVTKKRLKEAQCEVFEYEGNHISVLGGGGPTCLTRPLFREL